MSAESYFSSVRLLVLAVEETSRQELVQLLNEEGYAVSGVAALKEALTEMKSTAFALILADLSTRRSRPASKLASLLRHRPPSMPLGIVTAQVVSRWDKRWRSVDFSLSRPVKTTRLLTEVAACLKKPLSIEQARQAEVLRSFVEAIVAKDWNRLRSLCARGVNYAAPRTPPHSSASPLRGIEAIQTYAASVWQDAAHLRLDVSGIYPRPAGLALRYLRYSARPGGEWSWQEETELFGFVGEQITRIGLPTSSAPEVG